MIEPGAWVRQPLGYQAKQVMNGPIESHGRGMDASDRRIDSVWAWQAEDADGARCRIQDGDVNTGCFTP